LKRKIEQIIGRRIPFSIKIAIDGPAASGKSTTAKILAKELGFVYIDTGAMYRAFTYKVLKNDLKETDIEKIKKLLENTNIDLFYNDGVLNVKIDNEDVTEVIRTPKVSSFVSEIAAIPEVRVKMVQWQRELANKEDSILDGRDIGTVVLPDAFLKIFMVCSLQARAKRRLKELKEKGIDIALEDVIKDIEKRDRIDSSRSMGPLKQAEDAILVDTSNLTIEEQVNFVKNLLIEKLKNELVL